jgi:hypothetical protein
MQCANPISGPSHVSPSIRKSKERIMSHRQLTGASLASLLGAGALFATVAAAQAAMSPIPLQATSSGVQKVDCAVGAHIGPLGGCILGNEERPGVVIERRSADDPDEGGCKTKTIRREDSMGNSETRSKSNC